MELSAMDNFVLTKCARVTCKDDGMNYCRLCLKHYCFEHLCTHLEQSRARGLGQRALEEAAKALHSELTRRWVATPAVQWPSPLPASKRPARGMDSYQFITNKTLRTILSDAKTGKLDAAALIAALTKLQNGAN